MARDREAERAAAHARAVEEINTAVEAAEQVEATPQALMASHRDLRAIGVGHGDWSSLVQRIGGYGPSLQEAIVRLGALMARTLAALATQSCRAVESLLRARGGRHTRDSPEVSLLREVIELLRAQESAGKLRGLAADGMIDRVRSRPIRSLQHSPHDPPTLTQIAKPRAPSLRRYAQDPFNASAATAMERLQAVRSQRDVAPPSMSGPVYTAYCAATVMSERVHAAAIVEAVEAAEQVEATPAALMALLRDLRAIGVGHGDWSSLVQNIGGYGPSLQEAIVRLGACISRTRAALATQSCRAVESLPSAPGSQHTRDSPEVSMLREVVELLRRLESDGRLRGLVADGLIDRVRPRPTRSLRHSCARTARLERTANTCPRHSHGPQSPSRTLLPSLRTGP